MDQVDTTLHLMITKGRSCLFGGRASMVLDFFIAAQIYNFIATGSKNRIYEVTLSWDLAAKRFSHIKISCLQYSRGHKNLTFTGIK